MIICFYRSNPAPFVNTEELLGGNFQRGCLYCRVYWVKTGHLLTSSPGKTAEETRSWVPVTCVLEAHYQTWHAEGEQSLKKEIKWLTKWQDQTERPNSHIDQGANFCRTV